MSDQVTAIRRAAQVAGSQQALADLLGLRSQGAVQNWIMRGRIPAERVLAVEAATGVSRHDLRPDLYPREPRA